MLLSYEPAFMFLIHHGDWPGWVGTLWDVKHVSVGLTLDAILAQVLFVFPTLPALTPSYPISP